MEERRIVSASVSLSTWFDYLRHLVTAGFIAQPAAGSSDLDAADTSSRRR